MITAALTLVAIFYGVCAVLYGMVKIEDFIRS